MMIFFKVKKMTKKKLRINLKKIFNFLKKLPKKEIKKRTQSKIKTK